MATSQPQTPVCPDCGSSNVVPIVYGLVRGPLPAERNYVLGGCVVAPHKPIWACRDCRAEFGRLDERAPAMFGKPQPQS